VADLVISGPADSVQRLVPSRIVVTLSLTGLPEGTHHLPGQAVLPPAYALVSLEPQEFMAIIGDATQGNPEQRGP
jgi:hypothetical protein